MILLDMLKLLYKKNKKQTQTAESEGKLFLTTQIVLMFQLLHAASEVNIYNQ